MVKDWEQVQIPTFHAAMGQPRREDNPESRGNFALAADSYSPGESLGFAGDSSQRSLQQKRQLWQGISRNPGDEFAEFGGVFEHLLKVSY